jgi:ABC-type phosphate transport system substrate-binding protein
MIKAIIRYLLQLIYFVYILGAAPSALADQEYNVIVHPDVVEKNLSVNTLRAIFGMRMQTWPDGTKIRVFVLPDEAPLHQKFSKGMLRVFPYQLRAAWDRLVFSGIGHAPISVASPEEMQEKVSSTPGAIGYLWKNNIHKGVDVLQVQR